MKHPRVIVYETDGRLAALLRPLAQVNGWSLRELRRTEDCLSQVSHGPGVVLLRIGRDLDQEFALLDTLRWTRPNVSTVVVTEADQTRLVPLAWDLGAAYVHLPSAPRESLAAVVAGLMGVAFIVGAE